MKAIVTIIDDDGTIIEKDKVVFPYSEVETTEPFLIPTITTYFRFGITKVIKDTGIYYREE